MLNSPTPSPKATWQLPTRSEENQEPILKVYNSFTKTKVEFVTKKPGIVSWYNCGPTVYDVSHLGHARNYLTQDIIRRILRDYFGYELNFVMNITDVDDKIILKARHVYLFSNYVNSITNLSATLLDDVKSAWVFYFLESFPDLVDLSTSSYEAAGAAWLVLSEKAKDSTWVKSQDEKFPAYMAALIKGEEGIRAAAQAFQEGRTGKQEAEEFLESNRETVGSWLDHQFGSTITDLDIFRNLAANWEESFFNSMRALRVERPTTVTRVSEYIPEIVQFIQDLVGLGFAYEAGGSVWFDTTRFDGYEAGKEGERWHHTYSKLRPSSQGHQRPRHSNRASTDENKRNVCDFVVWKASKSGKVVNGQLNGIEPTWDSPWGPGRPGWHIECSVMAGAMHADGMDVHSGGIDLVFPHHVNEVALAEAHQNCHQWVNYFLHTGHLEIKGLKMSKSLKNFISIDDALKDYSPRQLRFSFLQQMWHAQFEFSKSGMQDVRASEAVLNNFFANTNALISEWKLTSMDSDGKHHFDQAELDLISKLEQAQLAFREALCDSFDTPKAIQIILNLVSTSNVYVGRGRALINVPALAAVAEWVTRMLRMFGLGEGSPVDFNGEKVIGWGEMVAEGQGAGDREAILMPYLRVLSTFRDKVRSLAISGASSAEFLALSDELRDVQLVDLGVALDDQADGRALPKLISPEILRRARDEKAAAEKAKADKKAATLAALEVKRLERIEKGRVPPTEMYKTEEYSAWDDKGIPTKDKAGEDLPKSKSKKLMKEWDLQTKLHDAYLGEMGKREQ